MHLNIILYVLVMLQIRSLSFGTIILDLEVIHHLQKSQKRGSWKLFLYEKVFHQPPKLIL
ncbi:hypothetical protein FHS15_004897 [Paenibacillus castaneae]|nr:hypothetical protein [Paenibacillus castaneae]